MLKVKSGSWHYRLWMVGRKPSSRPKNLCKYFWHNVLKIVTALIIVGLALAGVGALLLVLYSFPVQSFLVVVITTAGIGAAVLAIALIQRWADRRQRIKDEIRWGERPAPKPKKPKGPPPMWWIWLMAKKAKYCPLIQVVDDDKATD